ncbi:unnamed protein product [Thlaspi arvense]|uniref:TFIIB-type domain-containing protein n=1 Tax=Thlaspi arvense TaxID=13288 RepID=A0AAU9RLL5_THLAR|nr:unnamed protein product [Thlaspi arvense]
MSPFENKNRPICFLWLGIYSNASNSNTMNLINMVASRPKKKRKGSELCQSNSIYEQEWALTRNKLCEKVDPSDEAISPSKRRLVLSTHLMQQLLQPAPAFVFSGNKAAFNYETVLHFVSRFSLANACSLDQSHSDLNKSRTNCQTWKITASDQDQRCSSLVKYFMEKMQKLESDFQSLDCSTTSILGITLEIQDLERFSVINRLAKFHCRTKTMKRSAPQRYVVEIQMPMNLPEPLHCLPLLQSFPNPQQHQEQRNPKEKKLRMEGEICLDCKRPTVTVTDQSSGDTICTECGLVMEAFLIEVREEYRTFANDDGGDRDPHRVGAPTNPLLKSGGLSTIIDKRTEKTSSVSKADLSDLFRTQNLVKNSEEDLIVKACKEIKRMTDDLGLISGVEFRACEIISKFDESNTKRLRRGKQLIALCAASVSTACRELKLSRTLKEIATVAEGVELKDINKASMAIKRLLGSDQAEAASEAPQVIINTGELVRRFCSKLRIGIKETKAIREAVEKAESFDIRRTPKSILAAVIFMINQLSPAKKSPIRDIALVAEVVENTIKNTVKDMYPYALKIIPQWYASEEDIIKTLGGILGSWDSAKSRQAFL